MDFIKTTEKILKELNNPLPGRESHLLMAPEIQRTPEYEIPEREGAVLLCLYADKDDIRIVFIKRTEYEGPHSGQISFPGGLRNNTDKDLMDTALRETEEETGILRSDINILGRLSTLHIPVSNIIVHPFIAYCKTEPFFRIDKKEVQHLIVPLLKVFLDPENIKKEKWILSAKEVEVPFFNVDGHKIWGATAMILSEFICLINKAGIFS